MNVHVPMEATGMRALELDLQVVMGYLMWSLIYSIRPSE